MPALTGWVVARTLAGIGYLVALAWSSTHTSPTAVRTLGDGLFIWDGMYYRSIALDWYDPTRIDMARFFPGYPAVGRLGDLITGRGDVVLVLANYVAALAAAVLLWRLVEAVTGDRAMSDRASWMISVVPPAFVLTLAYTEGLALLLTVCTLLCLQRRQFAAAGAVAFAAALLRPVGVLLVVAIVVELWRARRTVTVWQVAAGIVGPGLGLATAMWWISRSYSGDLMIAFTSQQAVRGGFQDPFTRMIEPFYRLLRGNTSDLLNLLFAAILLCLMYVMVRRKLPASWVAFSGVSLLMALSAQVIDSIGRYGFAAVPFIVALAAWSEKRWQQVLVAGCSAVGFVSLVSLAWLGIEVP